MGREAEPSVGLDIAVDRDAEIPIGVQLAWALRSRIHDGAFEPGQRLPGLRELALRTGVNVNTVQSVYQRLEREGLLERQQGSGTFVSHRRRRSTAAISIAAGAAREARDTGVDPREVAAALYVSPEPTHQADGAQAQRRRQLREQIATLERTLAELEIKHPGVAARPAPLHRDLGPALLDAQQLEEVQSSLLRRLVSVQSAIDAVRANGTAQRTRRKQTRRSAPAGERSSRARAKLRPAPATEGA